MGPQAIFLHIAPIPVAPPALPLCAAGATLVIGNTKGVYQRFVTQHSTTDTP